MACSNPQKAHKRETFALILSVFIAGLCSIIYELLIGTTSAYFLGDSVKQFSLTIGIYMASMGLGAFYSRRVKDERLLEKFIAIEILLGFCGGISVPLLYFTFAYSVHYSLVMLVLIVLIGFLIGLEIPFLTRIMETYYILSINLSNVLTLDYFGALVATLLFPFFLLPVVGCFRSSMVFGLVNMGIGILILTRLADRIDARRRKVLLTWNLAVAILMLGGLIGAGGLLKNWTDNLYQDRVIYSKESKFQQIVLTKDREDIRLYLNGNLQFASSDEYRYHEGLIHPALSLGRRNRVLILGGGDGLAAREILKYPDIEAITLVDLDPTITRLASENPHLLRINQNSLKNSKVRIINEDAFTFLLDNPQRFDIIVADLPDPGTTSLTRLYSREFYKLVRLNLTIDGLFVTQATSPFYARKAFWCIRDTLVAAGFSHVIPYHLNVPSFGEWGFMLAADHPLKLAQIKLTVATRFLDEASLARLFVFAKDLKSAVPSITTLDQPVILTHYLAGWTYWR